MLKEADLPNESAFDQVVASFENELKLQFPQLDSLGIYMDNIKKCLILSDIYIKERFRGTGVGSKVMHLITKFADDHKLPIVLIPDSEKEEDAERLIEFYETFGFLVNKDKNINAMLQEPDTLSMYRLPRAPHSEQTLISKERLKKAFVYFIKDLHLPKNKIKLAFGTLDGNDQGKLKVKGIKKPYKVTEFKIIMRDNNPQSEDAQLRTLAHEIWHIKQITDGYFNTYENEWKGVKYPEAKTDVEEHALPWEIDARQNSERLAKEFNVYMREKYASKQYIKVK